MRCLSPDSDTNSSHQPAPGQGRPVSTIPSDMDQDPNADEEVIDQQTDGMTPRKEYPRPADLANSIAYALDGSGPDPATDLPNPADSKAG